MGDILTFILTLVVLILTGVFTTFFVALNLFFKDEIWEELYERTSWNNDKEL